MKAASLFASRIAHYVDAWNRAGRSPQVGLLPIVRRPFGLEKHHPGSDGRLTMGNDFFQLAEARPSAGTTGVGKQDERFSELAAVDRASAGPLGHELLGSGRRIVVPGECCQADTDRPQPQQSGGNA